MKFRTEYIVKSREVTLDYDRGHVLVGSCFADNMGERLHRTGWQVHVNPCGVLYNPASIASTLRLAMAEGFTPVLELHPATGNFFSFDFSTRFSHPEAEVATEGMRQAVASLRAALLAADSLFVTFGTSWVFETACCRRVVANCHKLPPERFVRRCMALDEMAAIWFPLVEDLHRFNPGLKIVFTVSPVRHLADGLAGNARSKARLLLLCEQLAAMKGCHYFPAFEIVTDDLRDYRFYADDLTHPSSFAADYVFEKFVESYVDIQVLGPMQTATRVWKATHHRPINPASR